MKKILLLVAGLAGAGSSLVSRLQAAAPTPPPVCLFEISVSRFKERTPGAVCKFLITSEAWFACDRLGGAALPFAPTVPMPAWSPVAPADHRPSRDDRGAGGRLPLDGPASRWHDRAPADAGLPIQRWRRPRGRGLFAVARPETLTVLSGLPRPEPCGRRPSPVPRGAGLCLGGCN
jgi:hypothetical protein